MRQFFRRIFPSFFFLFIAAGLWAQSRPVTGRVTDEKGQPLAGVSIFARGSTIGATSKENGEFSLSVPLSSTTLVFSAINYTGRELPVLNGPMQVILRHSAANLDEVVVVGYGTQKLSRVSGAISTVKAEDIEKLHPVRAEEALQGRASGVTVIQNGSPGSKPVVLIRGIPSFSGTDPAVIIDGSPQTLNDLNALNPADIESVNVLKDAATTAIYGVKGGNGVILITTRSGRKNQKSEITIGGNYGIQEVLRKFPVLNATEYGAMVNEGSVAAGGKLIFPDPSVLGAGTDWQKEIFHQSPIQTYNISARGGSDKMTYFLSGGWLGQDGVVGGGDKSNFRRMNATANLNFDLSTKLKLILNSSYVNMKGQGIQENSFNSIIGSALNFDPTTTVLNTVPNSMGKYGFSNLILSEIFNPLTKLGNSYNTSNGNKLYGKAELQYDLLKGLKLTTRFGYVNWDQAGKSFTPLVFYGPLNVENTLNGDGTTVTGKHNSVNENKSSIFNYTYETFANYNFRVKEDHNFETVLGFSIARSGTDGISGSRQDVPFNSWTFADLTSATGTNSATNTSAQSSANYQSFRKNLSYFGRINYDYKGKYLASFTARRDGSYAFGPKNKFANFYSGSLGWVITQEEFFRSQFISYLKVRGSYGSIGNENVNPQLISIVTGGPNYTDGNNNGYTFGNNFVPGSTVGSYKNDALAWEKQIQSNIGFDLSFFKNKFSISADYFRKNVNGLLFTPTLSLYLGTATVPTANIGSTKSSGVDLTLGYTDKIGRALRISNSITFTTAQNLVTATNSDNTAKILGGSYYNGSSQNATVFQKGFTPWYFYGYKTMGLFQTASDLAKAPAQAGARPGDIRYVDVNKDGVIDAKDQTKIGDPFPKFTMGWNLALEYKNFDCNAFTYASVGNDVFIAYERNGNYTNKPRSLLGRWTGPGSTNNAKDPRYSFNDANSNIRISDRYVEDGSFVKIKNIQLGYTLPASPYRNKIFHKIRVYAQVKNAYTFTKYPGYDPEIASGSAGISDTGVDRGQYPQTRTWSVGIDAKF